MDSSIARDRITSVIRPDTMTVSQADFLVTHVPNHRLWLLNRFEMVPERGKSMTENDVYSDLVLNPENRHQFVAIYGQSGTGKSHLIRWLEARFRRDKQSDEVVLFVRRSDNTLKGTIRQLLAMPEVRGIANREVYERLVRATFAEDEEKLKGSIYYDFLVEIQYDEGEHDIVLKNYERKRLVAFLSNEAIREHLMSPEGPIERIFSRIAENTNVDRDTIAQFEQSDFYVTPDLFDDMSGSSDPKAEKLARKLMDKVELASEISAYMNQFVNDVVQNCAGIHPGDFSDIFSDIRRELLRQGKTLTLFIEDVTSFTGVDSALLDALLVEHTGGTDLCRISSFVGTTSYYLDKNFRDNHKDRITHYVYVPDGAFGENELYEFVARYLNAMSLPSETVERWAANDLASASSLPVHEVKEGKNWEFVETEYGKKLNLYPFTRRSITYYYNHALSKGQRTPRYIIRDIIEPVVRDVLYNKEAFPSGIGFSVTYDQKLWDLVQDQVGDAQEQERLRNFLTIWGDGSPQETIIDGITYLASIRADILQDFGMPRIKLLRAGESQEPGPKPKPPEPDSPFRPLKPEQEIPEEAQTKLNDALQRLNNWSKGGVLDYSSTGGISGVLRSAFQDINAFVESSVSWQSEGVSFDNITKIKRSSRNFVTFERPAKSSAVGFYVLPADGNSVRVIRAFLRWRLFGKESWNYEGSDYDSYLVTNWLLSVKNKIVKAVDDSLDTGVSYIQAAIVSEIYRLIIMGVYKGESLDSISVEHLFKDIKIDIDASGHHKDWKSLAHLIARKGEDKVNADTVRRYFDIRQGTTGGSMIVLDMLEFRKALTSVKACKLKLPGISRDSKDTVKPRNDIFVRYLDISERVERTAASEKEKARQLIKVIDDCLLNEGEAIDEDAIVELIDSADQFYMEANKTKLSLQFVVADDVRKKASVIAKAINRARKGIEGATPLEVILAFSTDPIGTMAPLVDFLEKLSADLNRAELRLQQREEKLRVVGDGALPSRFRDEVNSIASSARMLVREV